MTLEASLFKQLQPYYWFRDIVYPVWVGKCIILVYVKGFITLDEMNIIPHEHNGIPIYIYRCYSLLNPSKIFMWSINKWIEYSGSFAWYNYG